MASYSAGAVAFNCFTRERRFPYAELADALASFFVTMTFRLSTIS